MMDRLDRISFFFSQASNALLVLNGVLYVISNECLLSRLCGSILIMQVVWTVGLGFQNSTNWTSLSTTPGLGLCVLLLGRQEDRILGALVAIMSCASLMLVVWPRIEAPDDNQSNRELGQEGSLREPLLAEEAADDQPIDIEAASGENASSEDDEESGRLKGTRRLLQLAKPEVRYLYLGCLVLLVRLPFSLAMPHFVSQTLGSLADADFAGARREVLHLLMAGTIDAVLDFWGFFLFGYANQRIVKTLRIDLFRKLLGFEVAFFDSHTSGELSSRINADCSEMAGDLTWFFRFSIESIVRITGIASYMLIRSPTLGGCALVIVPFVALINKLYGDWLRNNATKVQDALAEANSVAQEVLSNVRTVIAFAAERQETEKYQSKIELQYLLNVKQLFMTAVYYMAVSTFLINTIVQGALLWIGIILIDQGKLTPGILLAFMLYQSQLQNETLSLMNSYTGLIKSSGAGTKVFALLDRRPPPPGLGDEATSEDLQSPLEQGDASSADDAGDAVEASGIDTMDQEQSPGRNQYNVQLEQVTFNYPTRPDNIVLKDLNLEIPKGKTVTIVGKSGKFVR